MWKYERYSARIFLLFYIFESNIYPMKKLFSLLLFAMICLLTSGQKKIINLPDLPGYVTLKCDFHMHTVFSDGNVWPTYRLSEAVRDGLDAFAITDHIEYSPKKSFVPIDHNAAWKLIETQAKENNIIAVHGTEITRGMPPGHLNALFIQDASLISVDSAYDAIAAAVKQGAFIQWNHPGWKSQEPDGIPKLYDIHKKLLQNGWINGIEFFNDSEYYPIVLEWCKKYNLAVTGNSDIHDIISESYPEPEWGHRPMTLVFAKERTSTSLREAMFAGRTMTWFRNTLAGKEELAKPFFYRSIAIGKPYYDNNRNTYFEITNKSDIPFYLTNGPAGAPAALTLNANTITRIVLSKKVTVPLLYDVKNIMTGDSTVLRVELKY
jgi:3',5'-nucleoside bisphosphate phosphatase